MDDSEDEREVASLDEALSVGAEELGVEASALRKRIRAVSLRRKRERSDETADRKAESGDD